MSGPQQDQSNQAQYHLNRYAGADVAGRREVLTAVQDLFPRCNDSTKQRIYEVALECMKSTGVETELQRRAGIILGRFAHLDNRVTNEVIGLLIPSDSAKDPKSVAITSLIYAIVDVNSGPTANITALWQKLRTIALDNRSPLSAAACNALRDNGNNHPAGQLAILTNGDEALKAAIAANDENQRMWRFLDVFGALDQPHSEPEKSLEAAIVRAEILREQVTPVQLYREVCRPSSKIVVALVALGDENIGRHFDDLIDLAKAGVISRIELPLTPREVEVLKDIRARITISEPVHTAIARKLSYHFGANPAIWLESLSRLPGDIELFGYTSEVLKGELFFGHAVDTIWNRARTGRSYVWISGQGFRAERGMNGTVDCTGARSLSDAFEERGEGSVSAVLEVDDEFLDTLQNMGKSDLPEAVLEMKPRSDFGMTLGNCSLDDLSWDVEDPNRTLGVGFHGVVFRTNAEPENGKDGGDNSPIDAGPPKGMRQGKLVKV